MHNNKQTLYINEKVFLSMNRDSATIYSSDSVLISNIKTVLIRVYLTEK